MPSLGPIPSVTANQLTRALGEAPHLLGAQRKWSDEPPAQPVRRLTLNRVMPSAARIAEFCSIGLLAHPELIAGGAEFHTLSSHAHIERWATVLIARHRKRKVVWCMELEPPLGVSWLCVTFQSIRSCASARARPSYCAAQPKLSTSFERRH